MDATSIAIGVVVLLGLVTWVVKHSSRVKAEAKAEAAHQAKVVAAAEAKIVAAAAARETEVRVARLAAQQAETARKVQEAWDIAHAMPAPGVPDDTQSKPMGPRKLRLARKKKRVARSAGKRR